MANRMTPIESRRFVYQRFYIDKSQSLGRGAYGAVYKAKCDQLSCAAKVLHPTIVDPMDPGANRIMERFRQECALLESIRHPNIVQYLAMTVDPDSRLPLLLMELLDENLTKMLERSPQSLAYYIQVDLCHDVALAIAYLHSNNIIHRDLSSNNVLIIAGRRAKVTDFGMSKLAGAAPTITPLTMCPGTLAYMPPEALKDPPSYTDKLDCFSEGVMMIQMCTRLWPEPGPRTQLVPDTRSPTGTIEMPVLEPRRRKNHIDLIDHNHALLAIAIHCLEYQERNRPSSEELCQRIAGLKDSTKYNQSISVARRQDVIGVATPQFQNVIQEKDRLLHQRQHQIALQEKQLQDKDRALQYKDMALQDKDMALQDKDREITSRERRLQQLNQQLKEQELFTGEIQQTNQSLQRQVKLLQQQLSRQVRNPDYKLRPHNERKVTLNWRDRGKAPFVMSRGAAVVDGDVAYFMNCNGHTCSYSSMSKRWSKLPEYSYHCGSLAVVNSQLTAIGGCKDIIRNHTCTNKLFSPSGSLLGRRHWSEVFPPMPTKRRDATAVSAKEHLIVAGGLAGEGVTENINTVEVMDTRTLFWSTVASLPHPYNWASATICGDHLYMLGGNNKGMTKSVLTCSLTELLRSSSSSSSVWHRVADALAYGSTCAAVNGQLLAVGGSDEDNEATNAIHKYNPTTNSWDQISYMPTARYGCLVAVLPTNEMMAVGGGISLGTTTAIVEVANIEPS